jgi:DNA uptake protein ComE-like DNA-binding protein
MQSGWKSYFIFSKKEQRGIMVLGIILLSTLLMGILFPRKEMVIRDKSNKYYNENHNGPKTMTSLPIGPLFYFDPNTMDSLTAIRLGIPSRQVITLMRYRNKGGRFYRKEDIAKLYGLKKELVEKLIPYVSIKIINKKNTYQKMVDYDYQKFRNRIGQNKEGVSKNLDEWNIDINLADEKLWAAKTKLSPAIIQNIMRYRNFIGGFTNLNQMKKVYGFTEADYYSLKPHLQLGKMNKRKLNASTMTFENWKALGLFQDREIVHILRIRKEKGGYIGWKELVILFDLTALQAEILQATIQISE